MSWSRAILLLAVESVSVAVDITKNHDDVTTTVGEEMNLVCNTEVKYASCSFNTPTGENLVIIPGVTYANGILPDLDDNGKKCGIRLTSVRDEDHGIWECQMGVVKDGAFINGKGEINVTVAVAPTSLELSVANDDQSGFSDKISVSVKEDKKSQVDVQCVARQARPRPNFVWFIGNTKIEADTEDSEVMDARSGKGDFTQTLKYYANPKHDQQQIKCVVEHQGYTAAQIQSKENEIAKKLELFYKPQPKPKEILYESKVGQKKTITMKFEANPKPSAGTWTIHGLRDPLATGAASNDQNFKSTFVDDGELPNEYKVTLVIEKLSRDMAGKPNKLVIGNEEGQTEYVFVLEMGEEPEKQGSSTSAERGPQKTTEELGPGPVIGVIIVVIIVLILVGIAIIARSKGILCFAAKNGGEQLTEEKDGAAFDAAEKGEPLNPKDSKAANPEVTEVKAEVAAPKAEAEAEEKKSNGAHTPV